MKTKELLEKIHQNSVDGKTPTEAESAELKGFFKELCPVGDSVDFYNKLSLEFPIEFGEAMDELKDNS